MRPTTLQRKPSFFFCCCCQEQKGKSYISSSSPKNPLARTGNFSVFSNSSIYKKGKEKRPSNKKESLYPPNFTNRDSTVRTIQSHRRKWGSVRMWQNLFSSSCSFQFKGAKNLLTDIAIKKIGSPTWERFPDTWGDDKSVWALKRITSEFSWRLNLLVFVQTDATGYHNTIRLRCWSIPQIIQLSTAIHNYYVNMDIDGKKACGIRAQKRGGKVLVIQKDWSTLPKYSFVLFFQGNRQGWVDQMAQGSSSSSSNMTHFSRNSQRPLSNIIYRCFQVNNKEMLVKGRAGLDLGGGGSHESSSSPAGQQTAVIKKEGIWLPTVSFLA